MGSFSQYFTGAKRPHCLTVFIGGNHESSASVLPRPHHALPPPSPPPHPPPPRSYMHELPYGGWVAPGIFYLGYSGCIVVAGLRIAGLANLAAPPPPSSSSSTTIRPHC